MAGISIVFLIAFIAIPIVTIIALVDIARRPRSEWETAGQNQLVWVLLVVFVSVIGVVLYYAIARPRLEDAASITYMR
ncbi:PLDc N-terminal domain-containing protein [Actinomycetota bacterium]